MKMTVLKNISPTVIALGFVSLLTDLSSEMIYPLLPLFLTTVLGAGVFALGLIEGIAEATASILKIVSGYMTDKTGKRRGFILAGYSISSLMRPMIGIANIWPVVLFLRFMDRAGKGIRTSPRDALIADVTEHRSLGIAYGFHRAMDHAGAVLGPVAAFILLKMLGLPLRTLFLLAAVPAVVVIVIIVVFVREGSKGYDSGQGVSHDKDKHKISGSIKVSRDSNVRKNYGLFLTAVVVFTLGNSTDAFLLLRLSNAGVDASVVVLLWSGFHVMKMLSTYIGGSISDRVGRKPMVVAGWLYYAAIYMMFALIADRNTLITVFLLYGVYFGLTEPSERAWVSSLVPESLRGRAFGYYHGAVGIASLPASLLFGLIWQVWGFEYAFITGSLLAFLASFLVLYVKETGY